VIDIIHLELPQDVKDELDSMRKLELEIGLVFDKYNSNEQMLRELLVSIIEQALYQVAPLTIPPSLPPHQVAEEEIGSKRQQRNKKHTKQGNKSSHNPTDPLQVPSGT
jgi:hypothetical protein